MILFRKSIPIFASLTFGSGSCAALLTGYADMINRPQAERPAATEDDRSSATLRQMSGTAVAAAREI
jgi:hypothetical protein